MEQDVSYKGKVISKLPLFIRRGASTSYMVLGMLKLNEEIIITKMDGDWVYHNQGGWSLIRQDNATYIQLTENNSNGVSTIIQPKDITTETDYSKYLNKTTASNINETTVGSKDPSEDFIKSVRGIHGMPYQYMSSVDRRIDGSSFGRKFTEKIITRMPLLLLTPGRPKFMKAFSAKEREDIIKYIGNKENGSIIDDLLNREGKFYDLEFNYKEYYDYVNPMCQLTAKLLGLDNKILDGTQLDKYNWSKYANSQLTNFISSAECVAFYIDSEKQISETFSNSTGESILAGKANSLSDMGREIQFLLGGTAGLQFDALSQQNYDATLKEFDDFSKKYLKMVPETLINRLGSGFLTVATGGKMIFPEIWNESHFSRSYNVNLKLRTPDYDPFSWYMNIAVPLLHLIALVGAQQMGPNAYKSPFLVRGTYKGFFNVNMGIITDMNINKGDQSKWTINGLPTEVDISIQIKDLYDVMALSKQTELMSLMNNTALMDYLANMCGININKPEILRQVDIYMTQFMNSKGLPSRIGRGFSNIEQALNNKLKDIYDIIR